MLYTKRKEDTGEEDVDSGYMFVIPTRFEIGF